jgi:hypothetical protein
MQVKKGNYSGKILSEYPDNKIDIKFSNGCIMVGANKDDFGLYPDAIILAPMPMPEKVTFNDGIVRDLYYDPFGEIRDCNTGLIVHKHIDFIDILINLFIIFVIIGTLIAFLYLYSIN